MRHDSDSCDRRDVEVEIKKVLSVNPKEIVSLSKKKKITDGQKTEGIEEKAVMLAMLARLARRERGPA